MKIVERDKLNTPNILTSPLTFTSIKKVAALNDIYFQIEQLSYDDDVIQISSINNEFNAME
jgi:hypothetical protein